MFFQDEDSDEDEEDEDGSDSDEAEETALEGFTTPIDEEDSSEFIDEYVVFQEVMQSKK